MLRGDEENGIWIAAEMMAHYVESRDGIAEASGDVFGQLLLEEIGTERFILALFGGVGLEEEAADIAYIFRCSKCHN